MCGCGTWELWVDRHVQVEGVGGGDLVAGAVAEHLDGTRAVEHANGGHILDVPFSATIHDIAATNTTHTPNIKSTERAEHKQQ